MTDVIGICGYARSGKDTAADLMVKHMGYRKVTIADDLRRIVLAANPKIRDSVASHGWDTAKKSKKVREALQDTGAVIRSLYGETFLLKELLAVTETPLVVSDVRTEAEAALIRARGGLLVRIDRPGVGPANKDITERYLEGDVKITNDGDKQELLRHLVLAVLWANGN